jgi:NADPH:quinone reductase-like Zn-dependent oxidoreductase
MTAAVLTGHGDLDALQVRDDVAVPSPEAGQVLVRVGAAALNNTDLWSRQGAYGTAADPEAIAGWRGVPLEFPRIQGGDVAGRIVDVGTGVSTDRLGERVVLDPAAYDTEADDANPVGLLGSERDGGFAELVAVEAARAHDVDASPLTDPQLACLPIAYGTAMGMLERAAVADGERVLVTGASGGVGMALVQLAAARGSTVIAVTSAGNEAAVRAAGADKIVARGSGRLAEAVAGAADGPLDAIADVAGGGVLTATFPLLRQAGRVVIAGAVAGAVITFDLRTLYLHQRRLIGSSMHTPSQFASLVGLARNGAVSPRVAATYQLAQLHQAQRDFTAKGYVGKLVVAPHGETASR